MGISAGTRLAPVGAGGMGEVYRARDTRLERTVAIKVLPSHLCDSPDLKPRFEREAKAISQLNHPNICTLYDVGHENSTDYIVMEFLEGESLAERLKRGPLPLKEIVGIRMQYCGRAGSRSPFFLTGTWTDDPQSGPCSGPTSGSACSPRILDLGQVSA